MYLYSSDNCDFDLLVADNSRLAVLGLISMEKEAVVDQVKEKELVEGKVTSKETGENKQNAQLGERASNKVRWTKVKGSNSGNKSVNAVDQAQITPYSEEVVITKHKQSGHRRDGPQCAPVAKSAESVNENLERHMESLKVSEIQCEKCQEEFVNQSDLDRNMKNKHSKQWNCDQCDFQANNRAILMNHCKLTKGHLPSRQNQRSGQTGVLECYTCKSEFRNYHDLMTHRKEEHPSHKKCRYFLQGSCNFSKEECWYLHEDGSNHANNPDVSFQCNVCKINFTSIPELKKHMEKHPPKTFNTANTPSPSSNAWARPLKNMHQQDFHQLPPSKAPELGTLVVTLNLINQRLQLIENKMSQQQI